MAMRPMLGSLQANPGLRLGGHLHAEVRGGGGRSLDTRGGGQVQESDHPEASHLEDGSVWMGSSKNVGVLRSAQVLLGLRVEGLDRNLQTIHLEVGVCLRG